MVKTLILIPSRMAATRLPGKPLLKINDLSIISHVFKKAEEAEATLRKWRKLTHGCQSSKAISNEVIDALNDASS